MGNNELLFSTGNNDLRTFPKFFSRGQAYFQIGIQNLNYF